MRIEDTQVSNKTIPSLYTQTDDSVENNKSNNIESRTPLFTKIQLKNISVNSKKSAAISVRININNPEIYVSNRSTKRNIIAYQSFKTGYFIDEKSDVNPYVKFRYEALNYANDEFYSKIIELKNLESKDPEDYASKYKPIKQINDEINEYLDDLVDFYIDLQKQIDTIIPKDLPNVNEYVKYKDDIIGKKEYYTQDLPYKNPKNQTLTEEQKQLVDQFLDVFVDEYNKKKLAWYFGAILSNVSLSDETISKLMIVTSESGGSGKSTLINALAKGLLTNPYIQIVSNFDEYFSTTDKFSTSSLVPCRLTIFSEAEFNGTFGMKEEHDFSGLDKSSIKAWITEGTISVERKYEEKKQKQMNGLGIILTNHPPVVSARDLTRRFLSVVIKSGDMITDKSKKLKMNKHEVYKYIEDNAQAFANYFVLFYNINKTRYQSLDYDFEDTQLDISESSSLYDNNIKEEKSQLNQLSIIDRITQICIDNNIKHKKIIELLIESQSQSNKNIKWCDSYVRINSSRTFFKKLDAFPLKKQLIELYGLPKKSNGIRWIIIPK